MGHMLGKIPSEAGKKHENCIYADLLGIEYECVLKLFGTVWNWSELLGIGVMKPVWKPIQCRSQIDLLFGLIVWITMTRKTC